MTTLPSLQKVVFDTKRNGKALPQSRYVDELHTIGVVKEALGGYFADQQLTMVDSAAGQLVRFGTYDLSGITSMCLDPSTGQILLVSPQQDRTFFVNSSLEQFNKIAEAVLKRFPFYSENDPFEVMDRVAQDVAEIIDEIDAPALVTNHYSSYWDGFVEDIRLGDYAKEFFESD
jgi:hypothetical protein